MEFKKKYPCTQCIFLTTKESTLAKHMRRHQNVTEGEQVSNSSSPPSSDISPVLSSSKLSTVCKSTISEETNLSSSSMTADEVNTSKRIVNVFSEEFKNLRRNNLAKAQNDIDDKVFDINSSGPWQPNNTTWEDTLGGYAERENDADNEVTFIEQDFSDASKNETRKIINVFSKDFEALRQAQLQKITGAVDNGNQILSSNKKEQQFKCQFCPLEFNYLDLLPLGKT